MKRFSISIIAVVSCLVCSGPLPAQEKTPKDAGGVKLTDEMLKIHREALLIDGHNDLPWQFRQEGLLLSLLRYRPAATACTPTFPIEQGRRRGAILVGIRASREQRPR